VHLAGRRDDDIARGNAPRLAASPEMTAPGRVRAHVKLVVPVARERVSERVATTQQEGWLVDRAPDAKHTPVYATARTFKTARKSLPTMTA